MPYLECELPKPKSTAIFTANRIRLDKMKRYKIKGNSQKVLIQCLYWHEINFYKTT